MNHPNDKDRMKKGWSLASKKLDLEKGNIYIYFLLSGILKDYLRELPSQLITKTLYQVVEEAMTLRPPPAPLAGPNPQLAFSTMELLSCLPPPERVTTSHTALCKCWCKSLLQCSTESMQCWIYFMTNLSFHPFCNIHSRRKVQDWLFGLHLFT